MKRFTSKSLKTKESSRGKIKVLAISHACVVDVNQELFAELVKFKDLEIALVIPSVFNTYLRGKLKPSILPDFKAKIFTMRPLFAGRNRLVGDKAMHLHLYPHWWKPVGEFKPDIIHIDEEPWSLSALQFALSAAKTGAKTLFCSSQNILKHYPPPFSIFERIVFRVSNCAVACSEEIKEVLRKKGYPKRIFVITDAVKPNKFYPRNMPVLRERLALNHLVVGYVGRLKEEKGIIDFVQSLSVLSREGVEFQSLIVGSGPQKKKVTQTIDELKLSGFVGIIPAVPHNEISKYYNCIDILVVPSHTTKNWKEQFGRVVIEAMACGVPVIGSSSGEIPNIIRKTGGGLIFQEKNIKDLAVKIHELLKDERKRKELGRRGRKKVIELYSYEVVAKQFYEIYKRLFGNKYA